MTAAPGPGRRRREGGYSFAALIMAIVLVAVGVTALARTQTAVAAGQYTTAARTIALNIAQSHMESLRGRPASTVVSEPATAVNAEGVPTPGAAYTRTVTVSSEGPSLIRAVVTVSFPRQVRPVELVTFIYR